MSAEILRRAAALMRERAEAATPGPYEVLRASDDHVGFREDSGFFSMVKQGNWGTKADVQHIASWHPAVALAVADWLDLVASRWLPDGIPWPHEVAALAVARAYLGDAS